MEYTGQTAISGPHAGNSPPVVTARDLACCDIVVTTYDVLHRDLNRQVVDAPRSLRYRKKYEVRVPAHLPRHRLSDIALHPLPPSCSLAPSINPALLTLFLFRAVCVAFRPFLHLRAFHEHIACLKFTPVDT